MTKIKGILVGVASTALAVPAFAVDTTVADLFLAVTPPTGNVGTLLLGFLGISVLFLGRYYVLKSMPRGGK